jgi:annexin A13
MNKKTQEEVKNLEQMSIKFHDSLYRKKIDEETIVSILSTTSNLDRQIIRLFYKKKFPNLIQKDIQTQLSGDFGKLVLNLFDLPYEYDARELHRSLTSFSKDEKAIIEIIITRPRSHLTLVQKIYKKFYNVSLKNDILNLSDKTFSEFLITILASNRPSGLTLKPNDAYNIAKDIIKNGVKQYGKNVNLFKQVFVDRSREDLIMISRAFYDLYKKNLYDVIDNEISGTNKKLIKDILFGLITPAQWFAKKAYKAMKGAGTDDKTLIRVIVSRAEIDMEDIRDYYFRDRNTDLRNDIDGDCSGAYGQLLMNLSEK